ncbi:MAG: S24 family peptidase, partial [Eubacteriales bacterium]
MEPSFHDGDKVFVEKRADIEKGDIGIFVVNGDVFIKELGIKCLISHNKAYKPIPLLSSDSIYCCGRVLGVVEE